MRKHMAGAIAVAGAIAAFPGTATAQPPETPPTAPTACEQGQFTASALALERGHVVQWIVHLNKAVQCLSDVPPEFHPPAP